MSTTTFNFEPLQNLDYKAVIADTTIFGTSNALSSLTLATVKNIPYLLSKDATVISALSARQSYLEITGYAAIGTVVNLTAAIFYSALSITTKGLSLLSKNVTPFHEEALFQCKKNWIHTALSISSVSVASWGVLSPYISAVLNVAQLGLAGLGAGYFLSEKTSQEVLKVAKELLIKNKAFLESKAQNNSTLKGIVSKIDTNFEKATTWKEFFESLKDAQQAAAPQAQTT